ncbi:MAG: putative baseplate assembly protein, partial [Gammaproteobacteria bacterium]|nr:putative baseplate assembly protein [Gammaproteobacteria bacterium]
RTGIGITKLQTSSVHGSISTINLIAEGLPPPAGNYLGKTFSAADLEAEAKTQDFKIQDIFDALSVNNPAGHSAIVFHQVAPVFGHNAPAWESLPESLKGDVPVFETSGSIVVIDEVIPGPYKNDQDIWPGGDFSTLDKLNQKICPKGKTPLTLAAMDGFKTALNQPLFNLASENNSVSPFFAAPAFAPAPDILVGIDLEISPAWLFLDNKYKGITTNSQIILNDENKWGIYSITSVNELTKSCFMVTSKVTRLGLNSSDNFKDFTIRGTSVYFQSELLPLARVPVEETIPKNNSQTLALNGFINGLYEGQRVVLSGMEVGGTGKLIDEFLTLTKVEHQLILGGCTHITFTPALKHIYQRESVTINANVAPATHGETVQEVLGSGDATQSYQNFVLKQPPMTHVSAATPSGVISSLQVRVNDVLWHEVDTLLEVGPSDRVFVTHSNDSGATIIQFGNGKSGARLPTGQDNIHASYRKGIGIQGLVEAKQLNILMSRPLGLKEVVNPQAATGGDDPESHDDAQVNAPLTVLTLDRAVSLKDYEDFSRAFGGIAKASAISAPGGQKRKIIITVAGPAGAVIQTDSETYINLLQALTEAGDPLAQFYVQSYRSETFRMAAKIKVDADFIADKVLAEAEVALRVSFKFEMRNFAQTVALSEVVAVIQDVPGVLAVDVDYLYRGNIQNRESLIPAVQSRVNSNGLLQAAELLTLHPGPLDYLELMS